jgi:general secretion pathway protein K
MTAALQFSARLRRQTTGVAMIVVMWVIMVLSLLIGGFAFRMHVETQVASFSRKELKAEMLARSGIEVAKMQLMLDERGADAGFDALNQAWATNTDLLVEHELGEGKYTVHIEDEERKLPLNRLPEDLLNRLMEVLGVDPTEGDVIVDSIIDWVDDNDAHRLNGAEDDYYQSLSPPYRAKNGPFDRVDELLLVRGVTPEIFYGTSASDTNNPAPASASTTVGNEGTHGLRDLVTTFSSGQVNVNTASALVLQTLLGMDDVQISAILQRRDGPDGVPGTEDDLPFRQINDFFTQLGQPDPKVLGKLQQFVTVQSKFFRLRSTGEVNGVKRTIEAVVSRQAGRAPLVVSWRMIRGEDEAR